MLRAITAIVLLAGIGLATVGSGQPPKKTPVRPLVSWKGVAGDGAAGGKIRAGVVTDQANVRNLWTALGMRDDSPDVDFERAFVVVETRTDRILAMSFEVDDKGDVTEGVGQAAELKGGGFSYFVGVFPREGVKSYKGKPIKAGG
jgi:hypothetical protein